MAYIRYAVQTPQSLPHLAKFEPIAMPIFRPARNRQNFPPLASHQETSMSPAVLGSAIGAAAVTVGSRAATAVGNSLSFASELLRAAGAPADANNNQSPASADARAALLQRIDALKERIRQTLAAAGISLTQPVELTSNGAGGITV